MPGPARSAFLSPMVKSPDYCVNGWNYIYQNENSLEKIFSKIVYTKLTTSHFKKLIPGAEE
jgi:hypothetical protein